MSITSRGVPRFERLYDFGSYLTLRPLSQLETTLAVDFVRGDGLVRQIRTAGALASDDPAMAELDRGNATERARFYLLAPQASRSLSGIVRATYAFSPHLTF